MQSKRIPVVKNKIVDLEKKIYANAKNLSLVFRWIKS